MAVTDITKKKQSQTVNVKTGSHFALWQLLIFLQLLSITKHPFQTQKKIIHKTPVGCNTQFRNCWYRLINQGFSTCGTQQATLLPDSQLHYLRKGSKGYTKCLFTMKNLFMRGTVMMKNVENSWPRLFVFNGISNN